MASFGSLAGPKALQTRRDRFDSRPSPDVTRHERGISEFLYAFTNEQRQAERRECYSQHVHKVGGVYRMSCRTRSHQE